MTGCPSDASKVAAGACGCGVSDADGDADGVADCHDVCPGHADQDDADNDGIPDGCDTSSECTANSSGPGVHQGDVIIESQADLALLAGITCVTGSIDVQAGPIANAPMTTLAGVESLSAIAGSLTVNKTQLESLDGLGSLTRIGGDLNITENMQGDAGGAVEPGVRGRCREHRHERQPGRLLALEIQRQLGRPQDLHCREPGSVAAESCRQGSCAYLRRGRSGVIDRDQTLGYDFWEGPDLVGCSVASPASPATSPYRDFQTRPTSKCFRTGGDRRASDDREYTQTYLAPLQSLQQVGLGVTIAQQRTARRSVWAVESDAD